MAAMAIVPWPTCAPMTGPRKPTLMRSAGNRAGQELDEGVDVARRRVNYGQVLKLPELTCLGSYVLQGARTRSRT